MPRQTTIKFLRTTKANLDAQKAISNLIVGEPYLITDTSQIAVATDVNNYEVYAKKSEVGGESVNIETLTADKTLTASDATVQIYTSTAERRVLLPTTGLTIGHKLVITNNSSPTETFYLELRLFNDTYAFLYSQATITIFWNGSNWIPTSKENTTIGWFSIAHTNGTAMGFQANGSSYGAAMGFQANGSSYGVAVGRSANVNSKSYNTACYGAYSKAERNREFVSTATQSPTNKAQLTFQKFKEKDLATNAAAWQELFIDATSVRLVMIARSVYQFTCQINAINTNHVVKCWELKGAVKRDSANVTSLVGTITKTVIAADTGTDNWDVQITADDTNEAIKVEVKHDATVNVRYSLNFFATETRI